MAPAILDDHLILTTTFFALFLLLLLFYILRNRYINETLMLKSGDDVDIIIVGAGVAGAALAHTLGKGGRRVHVIERDLSEQDRIVGEILQPGGYLKLIELGLEDCVEEIDAQRLFGYAMFKDGKHTKLSYNIVSSYLDKFGSDIAGRSFHNGRFVQRLRDKASSLPNVRMEQGTVTSLVEENGVIKGVRYKTKEGQELKAFAPLTIVCDGCFSNLRRSLCRPKVKVTSTFVGLVLENCELPFPNYCHIFVGDPSVILYPISSSEVRLWVDMPSSKVPSVASGVMAKYLKLTVAPLVPFDMRDAFVSAVEKGKIKTMMNRIMPADPIPTPGALLLGDALNMRHPVTGAGMTVALYDIVILRDLLNPFVDLTNQKSLSKYIESFYIFRKPVASTINIIAGVLYKVLLVSPDDARREVRQACFDYVSLGGTCLSGLGAMLSGLNPQPMVLISTLVGVGIFGVGHFLVPIPSVKRLWLVARLTLSASVIIYPIIKAEGVRQVLFPWTISAIYRAPPTPFRLNKKL